MLELLKKNGQYLIYLILLVALAWLFQSSSSKYKLLEQSKKVEIDKLYSEKESLRSQIVVLEKKSITLENSLKKANKQVHMIIKKNADGSSTKEIFSTQNSEHSQNNMNQSASTLTQKDLQINTEKVAQESMKAEESSRTEIKETSRNNNVFLIIGGVALCVITKLCAF